MTTPNKGSVIERPASGRAQLAQQHGSNGGSQSSSKQAPSNQGDQAAGSRLNGNATESGKIAGNGSGPLWDDVIGEAVPLHERLIVSPCPGRFQAGANPDKSSGEYILQGQEIGCVISSDREVVPVKSSFSGWIMGYLVPEGSPVRAAEPVAWLRPH